MQPTLDELTRRYLANPRIGGPSGDVEPYDVATAFRVDARSAWDASRELYLCLGEEAPAATMPAEWPAFVGGQAPATLLTMAAGHYPQMVSDLQVLMSEPRSHAPRQVPESVLRHFPASSDAFKLNEAANSDWRSGRREQAVAGWSQLPDSIARSFNLGVAALAMSNLSEARLQLSNAARLLQEDNAWSMLAKLYLALIDSMR